MEMLLRLNNMRSTRQIVKAQVAVLVPQAMRPRVRALWRSASSMWRKR